MKNFGGIKTRYLLDGTNIIAQEVTNGDSLDYIYFFYDASGSPVGMNYLGNNYFYKKNLQGEIIEIRGTEDGSSSHYFRLLVEYSYDAWGNILQMNDTTDGWFKVGTANPFRYRGYYYDNESGFYYLQSRYYDPATGRFLNADDTAYIGASGTILGYSLFAYCENNPVSYMDSTGNWLLQAICGIAGAVVFGTVANILCRLLGVNATTRRLITAGFALIGGILGAAFGATLVGKIAPKALAWVRKLEQSINNKSRLRPMLFEGHVAIGWEWDHRFKIMLHSKHNGELEKGIHISIQHFTGKNWRKTIPDIPIKSLGKVFINWMKKLLK